MIMLSPIFILSIAIIVLLFLIIFGKFSTKQCAIFTAASLLLTLLVSIFIGYQILTHSETMSGIGSDNRQIAVITPSGKQINKTGDQTVQIVNPTESGNSASLPKEKQVTNQKIGDDQNSATDATKPTISNEEDAKEEPTATLADPIAPAQSLAAIQLEKIEPTVSQLEIKKSDLEDTTWQATHATALFACDGYGFLYSSLILLIATLVCCFAYQWFKLEQSKNGLFYLILLFTTLGGVILVFASHLISLFLGFELLSIPFIGLIGYQYTQKHSLEAAIKYMVLSAIATAFLLMGIAFYYAATGELTFSGLSYQLSTVTLLSTLLLMGVCLMLVGIGFKLSLVPFQLWLPDVYQGASTIVALLFSTVGKVAIFCAIARLFLLAPIVNNETIRTILIVMALCSILWGNLFALMQSNIKRLLAYSSIAHFGYLMTALIAVQYQVLALETIGVYLIGYILANIALLGGVILESHSTEPQDHEKDIDLTGLFWRRPVLALSMGIGLLSLAGVPLTVGFMGRFLLVLLSVTAELWWLIGAIIIGTAIGLYFYARLIINLFMRPVNGISLKSNRYVADEQNDLTATDELLSTDKLKIKFYRLNLSEVLILLSAILILLFGIYPKWLFDLVSMAQYLTS
ncbi:NADH-quinone oxidoreductase subunit N [Orbaceae bacterium ESL0721]|nr:NADH-quinone oxidoreductase subunit N [Orbaceae bacterium ESL0721]